MLKMVDSFRFVGRAVEQRIENDRRAEVGAPSLTTDKPPVIRPHRILSV